MEKMIKQIIFAKKANLNTKQLELIEAQLNQSDCSFQELANMLAPQIGANVQDIYDYLLNEKQMLWQYRHKVANK
jgi:predicted DNA-binding protein YlxM (UPF0122 family)